MMADMEAQVDRLQRALGMSVDDTDRSNLDPLRRSLLNAYDKLQAMGLDDEADAIAYGIKRIDAQRRTIMRKQEQVDGVHVVRFTVGFAVVAVTLLTLVCGLGYIWGTHSAGV